MSPAPSFFHQETRLRFYRHLHEWVARRRLGKVIAAPIDMVLSEYCVTQPDVACIAQERLGIIQRAIMGPADLVAEVVSLGGRHRDRIEKRDLYEHYGVKEYWIIDPESESVDGAFSGTGRLPTGRTLQDGTSRGLTAAARPGNRRGLPPARPVTRKPCSELRSTV